ncbi:MAG: 16S rRNA (guanine(966)-N(2))-methyltransferase RsmD [Actinomycetota bacterium]
MRVIAGSAKGTRLVRVPTGVRPVSDRAREGLFSSLGEFVDDARVLDLYAGTGALGIEALSRGASEAVFVDDSQGALRAVRENLARTGLDDRAGVERSDVRRFLEHEPVDPQPFDLVFLDPPYEAGPAELDPVLGLLDEKPLLKEGFTVVLSRGSRSSNLVIPLHWSVARRLSYGDSVVTLFRSRDLPRDMEV